MTFRHTLSCHIHGTKKKLRSRTWTSRAIKTSVVMPKSKDFVNKPRAMVSPGYGSTPTASTRLAVQSYQKQSILRSSGIENQWCVTRTYKMYHKEWIYGKMTLASGEVDGSHEVGPCKNF